MVTKLFKGLGILIGILVGLIVLMLIAGLILYPSEYIYRIFAWGESDVNDYLEHFPHRPLNASSTPFHFNETPDAERVAALFETNPDIDDFEAFLEANDTQAFIVIQDGNILYENYFNGTQRDSRVTSFSVAKSFTSAMIGMAIEDGYINDVNDPITDYLPELAARDARFNDITIRHLLLMASGLEYQEDRIWFFSGDDPLTSYYPDQREIALENTHISDAPEAYFQYNKYHPQLLGLILERTTGMSVTAYMQARIWDPLGMEFDGEWCLDSEDSGFEKMETGINARAIDFAKLGQLYLNNGLWDGVQIVPAAWVAESTQPDPAHQNSTYYPADSVPNLSDEAQGYYQYMWWGFLRGSDDYDYSAEGDHGQFVYVSPHKNLVIVRNGTEYSIQYQRWLELFYQFASDI